jgi:hypothetical protein
MLVTYFVQATLITLYIPILIAIRFDLIPQKWHKIGPIRKALLAVQHSTSVFLNASFLFSIAMLFAALVSLATLESHPKDFTLTAWLLSILMSFTSVLPVALLQLTASGMLRRVRGRILLWSLVAVLIAAVLSMSGIISRRTDIWNSRDSVQIRFEHFCINIVLLYITLLWTLFMYGLLCLCIGVYVCISVVYTRRGKAIPVWCTKLSLPLWWTGVVMAFCTMWSCLVWLVCFEVQMRNFAGESQKDTQWSFGQILALGTWAPFLVEFGYICIEGPTQALNGRLMAPYKVVTGSKNGEDNDSEWHCDSQGYTHQSSTSSVPHMRGTW